MKLPPGFGADRDAPPTPPAVLAWASEWFGGHDARVREFAAELARARASGGWDAPPDFARTHPARELLWSRRRFPRLTQLGDALITAMIADAGLEEIYVSQIAPVRPPVGPREAAATRGRR